MKKLTLYACVSLLAIGAVVCVVIYFGKSKLGADKNIVEEVKNGTLYIHGSEITQENVTIHYIENLSYADLPFTEVLKGLGFNIEWVDDNTADISYKDKKYVLDLTAVSFTEVGSNSNRFGVPGSRMYYTISQKELILDSTTIQGALFLIGYDVFIDIDYDKSIVYITESKK